MKKIIIPIYLKLVILILLLLGISLSSYIYYAVGLFKNDKVSYVFEAVNDFNEKSYNQVQNDIIQFQNFLDLIVLQDFDSQFIIGLINKTKNINSYYEIKDNKINIIINSLGQNSRVEFPNLKKNLKTRLNVKNNLLFLSKKINNKIIGFAIPIENIFKKIESSLYENNYFFNYQDASSEDKRFHHKKLLNELESSHRFDQAFLVDQEFTKEKERLIVSARKVSDNIIVLSSTSYRQAIAASKSLREKSIYFGLMIAGISIILIMFVSQIFSKPINKLAQVVNSFLSTDFSARASTASSDEIGFLASSFNKMANDITQYVSEMQEKLRMQEELKTANLVQAQFFPKSSYITKSGIISGHYESATECGGDWWGVLESDQGTVLILADVTGHGTSAALMTAVLHSSLNSLKHLGLKDENYLSNSSVIMDFLNKSFSSSTTQLNASAFVICLSKEQGKINYTNASHNPPFYLPVSNKLVEKSDVVPLMEIIGARLGETKDEEYKSVEIKYLVGDKIFFFTDGLIEAQNNIKENFGQRRFVKELLIKQESSIDDIITQVLSEVSLFRGEQKLHDDLTIIGMELN